MFQMISYLKTNKIVFVWVAIGTILFQLVRFSIVPFYLYLLVIIVLCFYKLKHERGLKIDINIVPIAIYIVMIFLSVVFLKNALDIEKAILGTINAFIIPTIFYIIFMKHKKILDDFIVAFKFMLFFSVAIALLEYIYYLLFKTYKERTVSIFFNPNSFAYYIVMIYPLLIKDNFENKKKRLLLSIMLFLIVLLTGSRTGLFVFCLEMVLLNVDILKKEFFRLLLPIAFLCVVFAKKIVYRLPRIDDLYNINNAIGQRAYAMEFVLRLFKSRNLFEGIGPAQFSVYFEKYKMVQIINLHSAHNLFLNTFCEYGIIGYGTLIFLVYLFVFISTFNMLKSKKFSDYSIFVGFICITIFQMFDMAEVTNIRMMVFNITYVFYLRMILDNFTRWRLNNAANI